VKPGHHVGPSAGQLQQARVAGGEAEGGGDLAQPVAMGGQLGEDDQVGLTRVGLADQLAHPGQVGVDLAERAVDLG
jgi:hypothetical protein